MNRKKWVIATLAAGMAVAATACGNASDTKPKEADAVQTKSAEVQADSVEEILCGGWGRAESSEVTDEVKKILEKAEEDFVGSTIEPEAYLGSQVVAGKNHAILCKVTAVVPDAKPMNSIVYIYEDLEGNCTITDFTDIPEDVDVKDLDAVWKLIGTKKYSPSENAEDKTE